jgi:hypothetical protein
VQSASRDLQRIDNSLNELTTRLAENHRDQTRTYQSLAKLRLDELASNEIESILSHADQTALNMLEKREAAFQKLIDKINNIEQEITEIQLKRDHQESIVNECAEQLITAENKAQTELESNSEYQDQLQVAQKADAVADRAEDKTELSEQTRAEKGIPFENDALFMYLWGRKYGQPEYKANPLSRFLDGWVARLCKFEEARKNYWMLLELPKRLQEHADSVRANADNELLNLQSLEDAMAAKHGVPELNHDLHQKEEQLRAIDLNLEEVEESLNQSFEEKGKFTSGEDEHYLNAINEIAKVFQRKDIYELQRLSNRTLDREDDHLVSITADLKEEEKDLQEDIHSNRLRQKDQMKRLRELEQVRSQFKSKRFDDFRSGFTNGGLIEAALGEFLKGVLNNRELWRMIERSQRHRDVGAWPDFGSGGLGRHSGRRRGGNTWHWPGSGGGFKLPRTGGSRSRGRGRGGFRTGGGF